MAETKTERRQSVIERKYKKGRLDPRDAADLDCLWHEWDFYAGLRSSATDPRSGTVETESRACDACDGRGTVSGKATYKDVEVDGRVIQKTVLPPSCPECLGSGRARLTADQKAGCSKTGNARIKPAPIADVQVQDEPERIQGGLQGRFVAGKKHPNFKIVQDLDEATMYGANGSDVEHLSAESLALIDWIMEGRPPYMKAYAGAARSRARRAYDALSLMAKTQEGARHVYVLYRFYGPRPPAARWDQTFGAGVFDEELAPLVDLTDCIERIRGNLVREELKRKTVVYADRLERKYPNASREDLEDEVSRRAAQYARYCDSVITCRDAVRYIVERKAATVKAGASDGWLTRTVSDASIEAGQILVHACDAYRVARASLVAQTRAVP